MYVRHERNGTVRVCPPSQESIDSVVHLGLPALEAHGGVLVLEAPVTADYNAGRQVTFEQLARAGLITLDNAGDELEPEADYVLEARLEFEDEYGAKYG
jgi:hypothetical protein